MSDPRIETLTKNTWTKIFTDVKNVGAIFPLEQEDEPTEYKLTAVDTGGAVPSGTTGITIDEAYYNNFDTDKDIYVYPENFDGKIIVFDNMSRDGISGVLSRSKNGIIATTFEDDYAGRGYAFQIRRRITIPATGDKTYYIVLDPTALTTAGKCLIILPLQMYSPAGSVYVDTYPIESYTGGSEITPARLNSCIENYAESKVILGATSITGTPGDELRQYIVGAESTNQNSGGGGAFEDPPKRFPTTSLIVAEFVNQESDAVVVDFGLIWYEI